jgi:hypothetical protein
MWLGLQFVSAAIVVAGVLAGASQALPVPVARVADVARAGGNVEATASEVAVRCKRGQGPCRVRPAAPSNFDAPSDYYVHDANKLPFGSERWRDQMRRENRLGNPG